METTATLRNGLRVFDINPLVGPRNGDAAKEKKELADKPGSVANTTQSQ